MPGYQARMTDKGENISVAFCGGVAVWLSNCDVAQIRDIGGALNKSMTPLRKIFVKFERKLDKSALITAGDSGSNQ